MFQQGKKFEQNQRKYKRLIKNHNLDLISSHQLNIINNLKTAKYATIEGAEVMNSHISEATANAVNQKNLAETNVLKELEAKFNTDMESYVQLYKKYLTELTERQSNTTTYRNITIKYDNEHYYVNKSGIARQFTAESWTTKDQSCPNLSKTLTDEEFQKLTRGNPINTGEMCGISQMNVQDRDNGTAAWIDSMGQKHIYTDWHSRNDSCPSEVKKISATQFNAIPKSNNYGPNEKCSLVSLDSPTYDKLVKLNGDLMGTVQQMKVEVNKLLAEDKTIDGKVKGQKKILVKSYQDLTDMNKKLRKMNDDIKQYEAEVTDQNLSVPSVQMHHLIWIILGGAFVATAIHNYRNL